MIMHDWCDILFQVTCQPPGKASYSSHSAPWRAGHWGRHLEALWWPLIAIGRQLPILLLLGPSLGRIQLLCPPLLLLSSSKDTTTHGQGKDVACQGCPLLSGIDSRYSGRGDPWTTCGAQVLQSTSLKSQSWCWSTNSGISWVKSEWGPCKGMAGRDQRKRQTTQLVAGGLISKRTYIQGLSLHLPNQDLKSLYRVFNWA